MALPPPKRVEMGALYRVLRLMEFAAEFGYIYGPTRAVKEVSSEKNTLRDRCSHISGLLVKTAYGLRALMKSALPLLITTAASRALYLSRVEGSRSDLSCHQLEPTSHRAAGLLHFLIEPNNPSGSPKFGRVSQIALSSGYERHTHDHHGTSRRYSAVTDADAAHGSPGVVGRVFSDPWSLARSQLGLGQCDLVEFNFI